METYKSMSEQALEVNSASLSEAVSLLDAVIETHLGDREEKSETTDTVAFFYQEYQEYIIGSVVVGGSILAVAIIVMLVRRTRSPRRRFPMGERRLRLDVNAHRKTPSCAPPAKNNEES
jgi:hypothetical protein